MQCLVSANERAEVKKALGDDGISVDLPFDFLLFTERGAIAAERKAVPGDLLASVTDGRLARECAAMREEAQYRFLIHEGRILYTPDGYVKDGHIQRRWTRTGVRNLLRSIRFVEGADIEFSDNIEDTINVLREIHGYFNNEHGSYRARPRLESNWPVTLYEERYMYWLQGLPTTEYGRGIGPSRAKRVAQVFPNPSSLFSASVEGIVTVSGIGERTAKGIWEFLHGK